MKTIKIKNLQTPEIQELEDSEIMGVVGGLSVNVHFELESESVGDDVKSQADAIGDDFIVAPISNVLTGGKGLLFQK